jgi:hypothetical protein
MLAEEKNPPTTTAAAVAKMDLRMITPMLLLAIRQLDVRTRGTGWDDLLIARMLRRPHDGVNRMDGGRADRDVCSRRRAGSCAKRRERWHTCRSSVTHRRMR